MNQKLIWGMSIRIFANHLFSIIIVTLCLIVFGCNNNKSTDRNNSKKASTNNNKDRDMSKNESAKILRDLSSKDMGKAQKAKVMLFEHKFDKKDIDELFLALKKEYRDDEDPKWTVKSQLFKKLAEIGDQRTLDFVAKIYPLLPENGEILSSALYAVVSLQTPKATKTVFNLIEKYHKGIKKDYEIVFEPFRKYSNMKTKKYVFERLCHMAETLQDRLSVYEIAANWLWDGDIEQEYFIECSKNLNITNDVYILFPLFKDLSKIKQTMESDVESESFYSLGTIVDLLGWLPADDETLEILKSAVVIFGGEIQMFATISLIRHGVFPSETLTEKIAEAPGIRTQFYDLLKNIEREALFPKKYLTQYYFAEGDMVQWLCHPMEYGRPPTKIELIEKRIVKHHNGKNGRVYLFKFTNPHEEDGEWIVGLSGIYPVDESEVEIIGNNSMTFSHFNRLSQMSIDEHFESLFSLKYDSED